MKMSRNNKSDPYRDYKIGVILSLAFHVGILFLYLPGCERQTTTANLQLYPVGMVEITQEEPVPEVVANDLPAAPKEPVTQPQVDPKPPDPVKETKPLKETKPVGKQEVAPVKPEIPVNDSKEEKNSEKKGQGEDQPNANPVSNEKEKGEEPVAPVPAGPVSLGNGQGHIVEMGTLPSYPKNAVNEGVEGEVTARLVIRPDGTLEKILLLTSSGDARLDTVVLRSFQRNWKYKPEEVKYHIDLTIIFKIKNGVSLRLINAETMPE